MIKLARNMFIWATSTLKDLEEKWYEKAEGLDDIYSSLDRE